MKNTERPPTLEEKLSRTGLRISETPPFFEVSGKAETVVELLKKIAEAGGCYGDGYRLVNIKRNLEKFNRQGHSTIDIDVKNPQGEVRMVRVQTYGMDQAGNLDVTFGGGGNRTTLAEMRYALNKAADAMLA